ncbi:MAG: hypothetical protein ACR2N6_04525 [Miltoncostaeaceae bacterium]
MRRLTTATAGVAVTVALAAGCSGAGPERATAAPSSPIASLQDDQLYQSGVDPAARVRRMARLGARVIRVDLRWDLVAPKRPADARDHRDPAYRWQRYDRIVSAARRNGVSLLFTAWGTPAWARDRRVSTTPRFPGRATRPRNAADFGRFGAAAARRYARRGVRRWEAWNEPNLPLFLRPQFVRRGGRFVGVSPATYRRMLNAFYREVKRVDRGARIGGGVTAPIGDRCPFNCPNSPNDRVAPLDFWRGLTSGRARPRMDRISHHPYPVTRPRNETSPRVSYVDLYNLQRLTNLLANTRVGRKPVWLTEFGFGTRPVPEYPLAVSERQQAAFLVDAYRRVVQTPQVELMTWFHYRDHPEWTSGLVRRNGREKPSARAFAFPVAPLRTGVVRSGTPVRVRGQARAARREGRVRVERRRGGRWVAETTVRGGADGSFVAVVQPSSSSRYRARWLGATRSGGVRVSRPFTVKVAR